MKSVFDELPVRSVAGVFAPIVMGCALVVSSVLLAPAVAQPATSTQSKIDFNIPAGPLTRVLNQLAEAGEVQFLYSSELAEGVSSSGLQGSFTARDAIAKILAGTGLSYRFTGARTVAIEKAVDGRARTLGPVRIEGAVGSTVNGTNGSRDVTATEGTKSYTSRALSIASKMPQSIKDTPQSVSVITQQRMQDQNITDFTSLMNQATGVSVVTGSDSLAPVFYSRGFAIQRLQVDGGAPLNIDGGQSVPGGANDFGLLPQIDMAVYDHAEVLRGADGLFNGYGGPGGVINLTRKRPVDQPQVVLESQYGSWNNYRAMIDASAPLGFDGRLRGRGVLAYQDQDYFYATATSNKTLAYGILEYDLSPATTLSAGFSSTRQDTVPFIRGLPRYESGADLELSRDTCLCFPWSRYDLDTTEVFARLNRSLTEDWNLKLNLTHTQQERSYKYGSVLGFVNPVTLAGPTMRTTMADRATEQPTVDLTLDGSFELFGHVQKLLVGANYARADGAGYKSYASVATGNPPVNVFDFDPNNPAYYERASVLPRSDFPEYGITQWGAYATLQLTFWEPLHLNLGLRYSHYEYGSTLRDLCERLTGCTERDGAQYTPGEIMSTRSSGISTHDLTWPPAWSLAYDLSETLSIYGSYTDIYEQQSQYVDRSGNSIDPITGSNIEAGVKWSGRDGRLDATLAIYRLQQENFAYLSGDRSNPDDYYTLPDGLHECCYSNESTRIFRSVGADLEVTGEVLPGWQLAAGYTYNKNEYVGVDNAGEPLQSILPQHLFKVWSSYQFQEGERLRRLNIGGGVNGQTEGYYAGTACVLYTTNASGNMVCDTANGGSVPYEFTQGFYAVVSVRAAYQIDPRWNAALNINNLFDRTYYQTVGMSTYGNWYGEPRSFMLTLRGSF